MSAANYTEAVTATQQRPTGNSRPNRPDTWPQLCFDGVCYR